MPHTTDTLTTHRCGGTILAGGAGETAHVYCDRCRAFAPTGELVPSGTDVEANKAAWDEGEDRSPEATEYRIESRIPGQTPWGPEGSGDTYHSEAAAERIIETLESTNDEGDPLEYRVVEV